MCNRFSVTRVLAKNKLSLSLLQRYYFTERGYRERFRGAKPEGQESLSQFIVRISDYFDKWVELAGGDKTFRGCRS